MLAAEGAHLSFGVEVLRIDILVLDSPDHSDLRCCFLTLTAIVSDRLNIIGCDFTMLIVIVV